MVVSNNTNTEEKTRLWIAVVLLSITLARLAFHLRIVAALGYHECGLRYAALGL